MLNTTILAQLLSRLHVTSIWELPHERASLDRVRIKCSVDTINLFSSVAVSPSCDTEVVEGKKAREW